MLQIHQQTKSLDNQCEQTLGCKDILWPQDMLPVQLESHGSLVLILRVHTQATKQISNEHQVKVLVLMRMME